MQALCVCCGKLPGTVLEVLAIIPEDIVRVTPGVRAGFCDPCGRACCDGITSCRLSPYYWERIHRRVPIEKAWETARGLDRIQWWRAEQDAVKTGMKEDKEDTVGEWTEVKNGYWRRVSETPIGAIVAEVLKVDFSDEYLVEVTVVLEGHALSRDGALSFQEATADCDALLVELITKPRGVDIITGQGNGGDNLDAHTHPIGHP